VNSDPRDHLTEKEILTALVDEDDLEPVTAHHLKNCKNCRMKLLTLEKNFNALGNIAATVSPELPCPVRLEDIIAIEQKSRPWSRLSAWKIKPALSFTFAVVLILLVIWGLKIQFNIKRLPGDVPVETAESRELLSEIDRLVENAMPRDYYELTGIDENNTDEEYMDFIVPSGET